MYYVCGSGKKTAFFQVAKERKKEEKGGRLR
jgi:hypothetical protein